MKRILTFLIICTLCQFNLLSQITWEHTNGPEGGATWYIYNNDNYAYFPDALYLYRTSDGVSWERLNMPNLWPISCTGSKIVAIQGFGFGLSPVQRLVISYNNGDTWTEGVLPDKSYYPGMVTTQDKVFIPGGSQSLGVIFQSDDDGLTWDTLLSLAPYNYDLWSQDNRLYTEHASAVWRLKLDGVNWEKISPTFPAGHYIYQVFAEDSLICISTEQSNWVSTNDGKTWKGHNTGFNNSNNNFVKIGNRIYKDGGGGIALIYTDDFGQNWKEYTVPTTYGSLDMATVNSRLLFSTYNKGVFYLDTAAAMLKPANKGLTSGSVYYMAASPDHLWAASGGGVFSYDLASQKWDTVSRLPIPEHNYEEIAISPNGTIATYSLYSDTIFISQTGGNTWKKVIDPNSFIIDKIFWEGESLWYLSNWQSAITTDYGETWSFIPSPMPVVVKFKGKYYGAGFGPIRVTNSVTAGWQTLPGSPQNVENIYSSGDRLFCVSYQGKDPHLYTSTDGVSWQYASNGLTFSPYPFGGAHDNPKKGDVYQKNGVYTIFAPELLGIFVSVDTCKTWLPVARNTYSDIQFIDTTMYAGDFGTGVLKSGLPKHYGALSTGQIFKDDNANGQYDSGELPITKTKITLHEPNAWYPFWFIYSDQQGKYKLSGLPNSADTIRPKLNNPYVVSITPPYHLVMGSGNDRNFAVRLTENITDAMVSHGFLGVPRPGFDLHGQIKVFNNGTIPVSGKLGVKFDSHFTVIGTNSPPNEVFSDSLVWNINNLSLWADSTIYFEGRVDSTAQLGSCLVLRSTFHPSVPDATPPNNHASSCTEVRGSYDPNDKNVEPKIGLTRQEILDGKELVYTIRFQNTGNWPAEKVRITDQLDTALNWASFRLIDASHNISLMRLLPSGMLEFVFDRINLPDSTSNEPESHGFVRFAIQRNKSYRADYTIENKALIFFDFNAPIVTNSVKTKLITNPTVGTDNPVDPDKAKQVLVISPNPASESCVVDSKGTLKGKGTMIVTDLSGRLIHQQAIGFLQSPVVLQTVGWSSGLYLVQMQGENGTMAGKLVVEQ